MIDKKITQRAFIDTLPVLTGYMVLGIGFGILMKTNGYEIWHSFAMSLFIYAGSMQYVAIGLIGVGASVICLILFGSDKFLIPAMLIIALALSLYKNKSATSQKEVSDNA